MEKLGLFDKAGKFTAPSVAALAGLTEAERAAINRIGNAAKSLDATNAALEANSAALTETQADIAALEKVIPRLTFNDLAKAAAAETMRRRAGI